MKKAKGIGFMLCVIVLTIGAVTLCWLWGNWTIRFRSELNQFFGKENWEVISEDVDYSRVYAVTNNAWKLSYGDGRKGKRGRFYREWNILCKNENGEEEVWRISNFTYKMNKERYRIYSSKRFKARQALTQELMEISFAVVEEEVHNEIVKEGLSEEEQQNVINSLANIEKRLLETYGENASFEILHAEYTVKYADGVKL